MDEPLSVVMAAGPMPVEEVIDVVGRVAEQLAAPHGELWPSAISLSDRGAGVLPPGTASRAHCGQYAAPEKLLGRELTAAADVFSLAAIAFHALTGKPPWSSPAELMLSGGGDVARRLLEARPEVPGPLAAAIEHALDRDAERRPQSPQAFAAELEGATRREHFTGRRMLVADDDAPLRDFYSQVAARIGVTIDVVATGRDAIAAMKSRKYDVALLDLNMPRLSGWEVLDYLRAHGDARPRKLFVVTGFADQHLSPGEHAVVAAVLYKPVAADELRTLVTECLRGGVVDVPSILRTTAHRMAGA